MYTPNYLEQAFPCVSMNVGMCARAQTSALMFTRLHCGCTWLHPGQTSRYYRHLTRQADVPQWAANAGIVGHNIKPIYTAAHWHQKCTRISVIHQVFAGF